MVLKNLGRSLAWGFPLLWIKSSALKKLSRQKVWLSNDTIGAKKAEIGMNLCFAPQISEHCPNNTPLCCERKNNWFIRPGTASALTPREGKVHEWITSVEEIKTRIFSLKGKNRKLLVESRRKSPFSKKESNLDLSFIW